MLVITAGFIQDILMCMNTVNILENFKSMDMKIKKMYIIAKCIEDTERFPKTSIEIMEMFLKSIILLYRENKEICLERFADVIESCGKNNEGEHLELSNIFKQTYEFLESDNAEKFLNGSIIEMNKDFLKLI